MMIQRSLEAMTAQGSARGLDRRGTPSYLGMTREEDGSGHVRWQMMIGDVPIWGGDMIAHMNSDGSMESATPPRVPDLFADGSEGAQDQGTFAMANAPEMSTTPLLGEQRATEIAETDYDCPGCLTAPSSSDLWVVMFEGAPHLAWRVSMSRIDGSEQSALPVRLVDATDGSVLARFDNLQGGTPGTQYQFPGQSNYSGTVTIASSAPSTTTYAIEDLARLVGIYDGAATQPCKPFTGTQTSWTQPAQYAAVDALYGAARFFDLMRSQYGRIGVDNVGGPGTCLSASDSGKKMLSLVVHYGSKISNAYFANNQALFGDGDGQTYGPFVSLDAVGHELMHGVVASTAGLVYANQSGALNESWADVFGVLTKRSVRGENADTWLVGSDLYTPGVADGRGLRSMSAPSVTGAPDHYSDYRSVSSDNGGVHTNSGIANHAFYLLAVGGVHRLGGGMTGIGADPAGRIWYTALANYMTSSATFQDARAATEKAANQLYGRSTPSYVTAVQSAWCLVGVRSLSNCPAGLNSYVSPRIADPDFERHGVNWTLADGSRITSGSSTSGAHGGAYYLELFASSGRITSATTEVSIASSATSAVLDFWFKGSDLDQTPHPANEIVTVDVLDANDQLLRGGGAVATFTNSDAPRDANGHPVWVHRSGIDLTRYRGLVIHLRFRTNLPPANQYGTFFGVDDVNLVIKT